MKTCRDCGELKPYTDFHRDGKKKDGLCYYCKPCKNARTRSQAKARATRNFEPTLDGLKICSCCKMAKPLNDFGRSRTRTDGYNCYCKPCRNSKAKVYYSESDWYERNRPKYRYLNRVQTDADRERRRLRDAKRRSLNPDLWREKRRERRRKFRAENPTHNSAYVARWRARKRGAQRIPYTPSQVKEKIAYWGGRCWICRRPIEGTVHMDHVKPLAKGGMDCLSNLRPACARCNTSKCATWPFSPTTPLAS